MSTPMNQGRRIPIHLNCPHCRNPIEIVAGSIEEEVLCPSCGSSFRLDPDRTQSWSKDKLPTLGKFELIEPIGRGAFGTVYRGRDIQLQRTVAIKVPRSGQLATDEDEDRFIREARNVAQLQHPGIVPVFEVGRSDTFPYIVSEFVQGITLADALTARKFGFRESAKLVAQIAAALQHAHVQGVVHRDLKPSNIMLTADDSPRVMDFGLAKRDAGEITMTVEGQVLGTPAYMSPEQASGQAHHVDGRSDIYSLGGILYELLTGDLPFRGNQRMLLHQVLNDEPRSPRTLNDRIPRDLETICLKAMAKEPGRRYQTAQALGDDLANYLAGQPITARPIGRMERSWRWCRRNPRAALLTCSVALLLATAAVTSTIAAAQFARARNTALAAAEQEQLLRASADRAREAAVAAGNLADKQRLAAEEETRRANRNLYTNQIQLAQRCWEEGDSAGCKRMLNDAARFASSGFEWRYLNGLMNTALLTIPDAGVTAGPIVSPDGHTVATGHANHVVRIWDAETFQPVFEMKGQGSAVEALTFSADGSELLTLCRNSQPTQINSPELILTHWELSRQRSVRVQTIDAQALISFHVSPNSIGRAAFSPDGRLLILPSEDRAVLWDVQAGKGLYELTRNIDTFDSSAAISPDCRFVALGEEGYITIWDAKTGQLTQTLKGLQGAVRALRFRPDSAMLLAGDSKGNLFEYEVKTGLPRRTARLSEGGILSAVYGAKGSRIAFTDSNRMVTVVDESKWTSARTYRGHTTPAYGLAYCPTTGLLVSAGRSELFMWDPEQEQTAAIRFASEGNGPGSNSELAVSPDGQMLAIARGYEIHFCDSRTGELRGLVGGYTGFAGSFAAIAFGSQGRLLASATGGRGVRLWNVHKGELDKVLADGLRDRYFMSAGILAFDTANERLAFQKQENAGLQIWDLRSNQALSVVGESPPITCAAFSPDGSCIVTGHDDHKIRIWDPVKGTVLRDLSGHAGSITNLAFDNQGQRLASSSADKTAAIWDAAAWRRLVVFEGHSDPVTAVTFSPDARRLATGSWDGTVRIWDVETGTELYRLKGHNGAVRHAAFHPGGEELFSMSATELRIWHAPSEPPTVSEKLADHLVSQLYHEHVLQEDVLAAIDAKTNWPQTFKETARSSAVKHAPDIAQVGESLWKTVRARRRSDKENAQSLRIAQALYRLEATPLHKRCLAFALYRTGQSDKSLALLGEANAGLSELPDEAGLRTLALFRLRRIRQATQAIEGLKSAIAEQSWAKSAWMKEAEGLIYPAALVNLKNENLNDWEAFLKQILNLVGTDSDVSYEAGNLHELHGQILGLLGRWNDAENEMTASIENRNRVTEKQTYLAMFALAAGDFETYRNTSRALLGSWVQQRDEERLDTAFVAMLRPDGADDPRQLVERAMAIPEPNTQANDRSKADSRSLVLGAVFYRAKEPATALQYLERVLPIGELPPTEIKIGRLQDALVCRIFQALALKELNRKEDFEKAMAQGTDLLAALKVWVETKDPSGNPRWMSKFLIEFAEKQLKSLTAR